MHLRHPLGACRFVPYHARNKFAPLYVSMCVGQSLCMVYVYACAVACAVACRNDWVKLKNKVTFVKKLENKDTFVRVTLE